MKALAVDFGSRRSGIAIFDSRDDLVFARPALAISGRKDLARALAALAEHEEAQVVVFGLPHAPDGQETELCRRIRNVANDLAALRQVEIDFVDESMTSREAADKLGQGGIRGRRLGKALDSEAAVLILESWRWLQQKK